MRKEEHHCILPVYAAILGKRVESNISFPCNVFYNIFFNAYVMYYFNNRQVCQLLKRGADPDIPDHEGQSSLDLAMSAANADIVTL